MGRGTNLLRGAFSGGMSGAGTAALIGATGGAAAPFLAVGAALGGLLGLSEGDPQQEAEAERQRRFKAVMESIDRAEQTNIKSISRFAGQLAGGARNRSAMLAKALGRTQDTEAYSAPGEQAAFEQGGRSVANVIQRSNEQRVAAEMDFANRPIEAGPTGLDVLETVADPLARLGIGMQGLKLLSGGTTPTGSTPTPTGTNLTPDSLKVEAPTPKQVGELTKFTLDAVAPTPAKEFKGGVQSLLPNRKPKALFEQQYRFGGRWS